MVLTSAGLRDGVEKGERTTEFVLMAVRAGFRGIDTACQPKHDDEAAVGTALGQLLSSGVVTRDELFIQVPCCSPPDPVHHHAHPASVHQPPQHTRARTRTHAHARARTARSTQHAAHGIHSTAHPPPSSRRHCGC